MSWTFIIIIAVLVFIAYQLLQLNRGKKYEIALKVAEKSEDKVREFFPHLYPTADEEMKDEIRNFIAQSIKENMEDKDFSSVDRDDLAYYIYSGRYKIMNDKIDAETDLHNKEKMKNAKEAITKELTPWYVQLDTMVDKGKISGWEKDFILWNFIKEINDQFPERYFELNEYFDSRFGCIELPKN